MIKAIIVDDERHSSNILCAMIKKTGFINVSNQYEHPIMALEELDVVSPEIAFIKIEIPEMNGMTLAEKILEINSEIKIVFITGRGQFAVEAFEINALDYLVKPIKEKRFKMTVNKIDKAIAPAELQQMFRLNITCFDCYTIKIAGIPIKWERTKTAELFAYLLMNHGEYVHKDIIIEALWPDYEVTKALQILQTEICKIRNLFLIVKEQVLLDYCGSKYCLIIKDTDCDFFCEEKLQDSYVAGDQTTYSFIEKACKLFGNGLFPNQGYSWCAEKNEEIKLSLAEALKEIVADYVTGKKEKGLLRVLKMICKLLPYEEEVNFLLLKTLGKLHKVDDVLLHYNWLNSVLVDEYNTRPSKAIIGIYDKYKNLAG